jgi:hypothetical protein
MRPKFRKKIAVHLPPWRLGVLALLLLAPTFPSPDPDPAPYERLFSCIYQNSPGRPHLAFCLLANSGEPRARTIAVYENRRGWRRTFLDRDRGFSPWTIAIAELDGDSLPELAVGVYKKTRYDPRLANRLFIYDLTPDRRLAAKWLGSRLGLDFDAFAFARAPDGIDRLLAVEHSQMERLVLREYRWNGFGFSHVLDRVRIEAPDDYNMERDRLIERMKVMAEQGVPE